MGVSGVVFSCAVFFALSVSPVIAQPSVSVDQAWFPQAPPLPPPRGAVIRVSTVEELFRAAEAVQPGGTILLADGKYAMPRYLELRTDNITLRGESGNRNRVVLDGSTSRHGELVGIRGCEGVTIADLTIQNIKWNGIKLNSDAGVQRVTIYNCVIHNVWQRGVKGVAVPMEHREQRRPRDCRIQYCLFYNDWPKRWTDDPTDTPESFNGNYIGGMDVMYATGWTISDNVFIGIRGRTGEARGAIFLWHDSRDCVIERNVIIDCDTGICLGNSHKRAETETHCRRCVVRNNFITRTPESGILADYTLDCAIVHNTIHDPASRQKRLIRLVHDNHGLLVANNLLSGPPLLNQSDSEIQFQGNVNIDITDHAIDVAVGDLHLARLPDGVAGACNRVSTAAHDFDGQLRGPRTNAGADDQP